MRGPEPALNDSHDGRDCDHRPCAVIIRHPAGLSLTTLLSRPHIRGYFVGRSGHRPTLYPRASLVGVAKS